MNPNNSSFPWIHNDAPRSVRRSSFQITAERQAASANCRFAYFEAFRGVRVDDS